MENKRRMEIFLVNLLGKDEQLNTRSLVRKPKWGEIRKNKMLKIINLMSNSSPSELGET